MKEWYVAIKRRLRISIFKFLLLACLIWYTELRENVKNNTCWASPICFLSIICCARSKAVVVLPRPGRAMTRIFFSGALSMAFCSSVGSITKCHLILYFIAFYKIIQIIKKLFYRFCNFTCWQKLSKIAMP